MSDYLRHLVARTLSTAGTVRPQLGSMFEPLSADRVFEGPVKRPDSHAAAPAPPPEHEANGQFPPPAPELIPNLKVERAVLSAPPLPPAIGFPQPPSLDEPEISAPNEKGNLQAGRSREFHVSSDRAAAKASATFPELNARRETLADNQLSVNFLRESVAALPSEQGDQQSSNANHTASISSMHRRRAASTPSHAKENEPAIVLTEPAAASNAETSPPAPAIARADRSLSRERERELIPRLIPPSRNGLSRRRPEPEAMRTPTIQVTIGRVEVRAVPPPRPTVAPTKPGMSLEEYLRERAAGGAR